jgi:hypothetical protein
MNTVASLLLAVLAAGVPPEPAPATKGKILLLETDRIFEGDIERVGDQYRVRRPTGETWVRAEGVLCLCDSLEEAYRFLRGRSAMNDADEHYRLARWCHDHGLRRQAVEEIKAAVALNPSDAELKRLLRNLQQAEETAAPAAPAAPRAVPPTLPAVDVSAEATTRFVTEVQPRLMNLCAGCHTTGNGGGFYLHRVHDTGSRKLMQQNLAATVAQINFREPMLSPLLIKAISQHSDRMALPPLKDRHAPAYVALKEWVQLTVATNPHLMPRTPEPSAAAATGFAEGKNPPAPPAAPGAGEAPRPLAPLPATPMPVSQPAESGTAPAAPPTPEAKPAENVTDVVDPEAFNRENHPGRPPTKP